MRQGLFSLILKLLLAATTFAQSELPEENRYVFRKIPDVLVQTAHEQIRLSEIYTSSFMSKAAHRSHMAFVGQNSSSPGHEEILQQHRIRFFAADAFQNPRRGMSETFQCGQRKLRFASRWTQRACGLFQNT
jgi:hypothetical protein